ncbi:hypothetical protein AAMO2058_000061900 [Amorphochlora amoebiformis]
MTYLRTWAWVADSGCSWCSVTPFYADPSSLELLLYLTVPNDLILSLRVGKRGGNMPKHSFLSFRLVSAGFGS